MIDNRGCPQRKLQLVFLHIPQKVPRLTLARSVVFWILVAAKPLSCTTSTSACWNT